MKISEIKGVGEKLAQKYARLKIESVEDLLFHLPKSYIDFSNLSVIDDVEPGELAVVGRFSNIMSRYSKSRTHLTEATFSDKSGSVKVVWFNQPYRAKSLKSDKDYLLMGELEFSYGKYQVINPDIELYQSNKQARIIANYPSTKGLSSKIIRKNIASIFRQGLDKTVEGLPKSVAKELDIDLHDSLKAIHQPEAISEVNSARKTIEFWELFALTLASEQLRAELFNQNFYKIAFHEKETKDFVDSLPFKLTKDQKIAAWQILTDMNKKVCNRLINGDVGSGKTMVAAIATLNVIKNNKQTAIIAPTTVLAKQHFNELKSYFADTVLLTSELSTAVRKETLSKIDSGSAKVVVGTHSIFSDGVNFKNLALTIIDEQHRFGVEQRKKLLSKNLKTPHLVSMSATPIPRSLALTLYGELDVSKIKEKPKGRKPIKTKLVSNNARTEVFSEVRSKLDAKQQVYVVCPLIDESEMLDVVSVDKAFKIYQKEFSKYNVASLHGKMQADEKEAILGKFSQGEIDILVSTTVIEVGVDVANANLMIIENAERFGLAQLHQLRGRVGRSEHQASCYLLSAIFPPPSRLRALSSSNDGFKLAEMDLELRGPGAIYGRSQHGSLDLQIASLGNIAKIEQAKQAAKEFSNSGEKLVQYPQLKKRVESFKAINYLN